jgi:hypothetical protein
MTNINNNLNSNEMFFITIEYISESEKNEGFAVLCHSTIDGIVMDSYGKSKDDLISKIKEKYKISKIVDYLI